MNQKIQIVGGQQDHLLLIAAHIAHADIGLITSPNINDHTKMDFDLAKQIDFELLKQGAQNRAATKRHFNKISKNQNARKENEAQQKLHRLREARKKNNRFRKQARKKNR